MIFSKISRFGKAIPKVIVKNDDLSLFADTNDEWIKSRTGINQRFFSNGETTSNLASNAAREIINSKIDPLEVDLIIVATSTADYSLPSTACFVQKELGLKNAFALDINAACSGFIYALSIADAYIKTGLIKKAIVIGVEILSKYLDFNDRSTCILFGDGAGAVLLEKSEEKGIIDFILKSDGNKADNLLLNEKKPKNIFNNISTDDELKFMKMNGRAIYEFVIKEIPKNIEELLQKNNIAKEKINHVVSHQANARIIEAFSKQTGIDFDKFFINIDRYGNTSAASIPIALCEMNYEKKIKKNEIVLLTAFGAGLTWGSMLIKF